MNAYWVTVSVLNFGRWSTLWKKKVLAASAPKAWDEALLSMPSTLARNVAGDMQPGFKITFEQFNEWE